MKTSIIYLFILSLCVTLMTPFLSEANANGKAIFDTKCVACHTIGQGKRIGPDLKGVTKKREISWIKKMIKDPTAMLQSDPIAKQLLKEHNNVPMIPMGLSDSEINAVVEYLKK